MNCQEITSKMDDISKEMYRFDVNIRKTPIDVGGIMKSRELVTLITNEILKSFDPALMIIKKLKDPATWEEFDSQVNIGESNRKRWISYPAGRKLPEDIFAEFSYYGPIKSESFAELVKFLDSIKVWLLNHLEALAKNYDVETDRTVYNRNQILRSICETFLNKTMRENSIISVSNLPEEIVSYDFAKNLKCGRIEIDQCGYGLGREMTGGEIFATNAGGQAGSGMQGGKIVIYGQTGGETGTGMEGGKIYVNKHIIDPKDRDSDWPFGYESKHGTLIAKYDNVRAAGVNGGADIFIDESASYGIGERKEEGVIIANKAGNILSRGREKTTHKMFGTLYAGQYTDTAPERSEIETFTFDHQLGQYIDLRQKQNAPIVSDDESLAQFKAKRCGLVVVESLANIKENITDGMDGGIIVLKELPKSELGKSMNRGAVIIDIPKIRREEILAVLSKDRDYGLILQRVPDPDDPDKTKLVDVEFQF